MNLNLLIKLRLSVFIIFFTSINTFAASPTIHKTAKPLWILPCKNYNKQPAARNIRDGAYEALVEEQINVDQQATYNHIITEIVSELGVQTNSEISVSFEPSFEKVDFHEIIVWRNNKPQDRLDLTAFKMLPEENEFDRFIYDGTYSAKYILVDIRNAVMSYAVFC